jgi:hypothetical protein
MRAKILRLQTALNPISGRRSGRQASTNDRYGAQCATTAVGPIPDCQGNDDLTLLLLAFAVAVSPAEQSCYEAARAEAEAAQKCVEAKHPLAKSTWQSAYLAAGEWKRKVCPH